MFTKTEYAVQFRLLPGTAGWVFMDVQPFTHPAPAERLKRMREAVNQDIEYRIVHRTVRYGDWEEPK